MKSFANGFFVYQITINRCYEPLGAIPVDKYVLTLVPLKNSARYVGVCDLSIRRTAGDIMGRLNALDYLSDVSKGFSFLKAFKGS